MAATTFLLTLSLASSAAAVQQAFIEDSSSTVTELPSDASPKAWAFAPNMLKAQKDFRHRQAQQLELLKKANPAAYEQGKLSRERRAAIQAVVEKVRAKKLPLPEARQRLYPLVKEDLKPELAYIDERIMRLEKQLMTLRGFQKDPETLVQQRVEILLGQRKPQPLEP